FSVDSCVQVVEVVGCRQRLREGSEDHGEDDAKRVVKSCDGLISDLRVAIDRGCDPRVGQLQQRSPTGAEKQGRLAMDPPADGKRSEDAGLRIGGSISNGVPETTHLDWRDGLGVTVHISDW